MGSSDDDDDEENERDDIAPSFEEQVKFLRKSKKPGSTRFQKTTEFNVSRKLKKELARGDFDQTAVDKRLEAALNREAGSDIFGDSLHGAVLGKKSQRSEEDVDTDMVVGKAKADQAPVVGSEDSSSEDLVSGRESEASSGEDVAAGNEIEVSEDVALDKDSEAIIEEVQYSSASEADPWGADLEESETEHEPAEPHEEEIAAEHDDVTPEPIGIVEAGSTEEGDAEYEASTPAASEQIAVEHEPAEHATQGAAEHEAQYVVSKDESHTEIAVEKPPERRNYIASDIFIPGQKPVEAQRADETQMSVAPPLAAQPDVQARPILPPPMARRGGFPTGPDDDYPDLADDDSAPDDSTEEQQAVTTRFLAAESAAGANLSAHAEMIAEEETWQDDPEYTEANLPESTAALATDTLTASAVGDEAWEDDPEYPVTAPPALLESVDSNLSSADATQGDHQTQKTETPVAERGKEDHLEPSMKRYMPTVVRQLAASKRKSAASSDEKRTHGAAVHWSSAVSFRKKPAAAEPAGPSNLDHSAPNDEPSGLMSESVSNVTNAPAPPVEAQAPESATPEVREPPLAVPANASTINYSLHEQSNDAATEASTPAYEADAAESHAEEKAPMSESELRQYEFSQNYILHAIQFKEETGLDLVLDDKNTINLFSFANGENMAVYAVDFSDSGLEEARVFARTLIEQYVDVLGRDFGLEFGEAGEVAVRQLEQNAEQQLVPGKSLIARLPRIDELKSLHRAIEYSWPATYQLEDQLPLRIVFVDDVLIEGDESGAILKFMEDGRPILFITPLLHQRGRPTELDAAMTGDFESWQATLMRELAWKSAVDCAKFPLKEDELNTLGWVQLNSSQGLISFALKAKNGQLFRPYEQAVSPEQAWIRCDENGVPINKIGRPITRNSDIYFLSIEGLAKQAQVHPAGEHFLNAEEEVVDALRCFRQGAAHRKHLGSVSPILYRIAKALDQASINRCYAPSKNYPGLMRTARGSLVPNNADNQKELSLFENDFGVQKAK